MEKRLLSILLVIVTVISLLPAVAFAATQNEIDYIDLTGLDIGTGWAEKTVSDVITDITGYVEDALQNVSLSSAMFLGTESEDPMSENDTFAADGMYMVQIILQAEKGYYFKNNKQKNIDTNNDYTGTITPTPEMAGVFPESMGVRIEDSPEDMICCMLIYVVDLNEETTSHIHDMGTPDDDTDDITFEKKISTFEDLEDLFEKGGNGYLATDITATDGLTVEEGMTVNLCLNGHVLLFDYFDGIGVYDENAELNIYSTEGEDAEHYFVKTEDSYGYYSYVSDGSVPEDEDDAVKVTGGLITTTFYTGWNGPKATTGILMLGGTVNMYGGTIAGFDGAVYVDYDSEFQLHDGKICCNGSLLYMGGFGAAVLVLKGKFTMTGGELSDNYATYGGAVGVDDNPAASFVMTGGKITGNYALGEGGGVYVYTCSACVAEGTLVTMSDGTQKPVEELKTGDMVRIFDHKTGKPGVAPLLYLLDHEEKRDGGYTLHFESGNEITAVGRHCFFEKEANNYIMLNPKTAASFVGHEFYNADEGKWEKLESVTILEEPVYCYSLMTALGNNANTVTNGLLSSELRGIFDYDEAMMIDEEQLAVDIEKFGLISFEDQDYFSKDVFELLEGQYLNLIIGRGVLREDEVYSLLDAYADSFISGEKEAAPAKAPMMLAAPAPLLGAPEDEEVPAAVYLGGEAVIEKNYAYGQKTGGDSFESNIFLGTEKLIEFGTGAEKNGYAVPKEGMRVGVNKNVTVDDEAFYNLMFEWEIEHEGKEPFNEEVVYPVKITTNTVTNYSDYLFSDDPAYEVAFNVGAEAQGDEYLELAVIPPHVHDKGTAATTDDDIFEKKISTFAQLQDLFAKGGSGYLAADIITGESLIVSAKVDLCLNNKVIKSASYDTVIVVSADAELNINDCGKTVRYWNKSASGLWTLAADQTKATDYTTTGGVITGADTMGSGGVDVNYNGTFNMTGGNIVGNRGMYAGGGVCNNGTLTLGGTAVITGNYAATFGGGGVYNNGTLTLGGTAVVKGNYSDTAPNDVVNNDNNEEATMTISNPAEGMEVGLYGEYSVVGGASEGQEEYFFANEADKYVKFDDKDDENASNDVIALAKRTYTVTFSVTEITKQTIDYGEKVTKPADPQTANYTFGGWYSDEACKQAWNFEQDTVTSNITLYAKWIQNDVRKAAISGNVTEDGCGVAGATVELYLGTVKVAATVTKDNPEGDYSFDNVENGIYNIVVTKGDGSKTKTEMVTVNTTDIFTKNVVLPVSEINSKVEHKGNDVPDAKSDISQTVVGGLDTIAEKYTPENDEDKVTIKLTVEPKTDTNTPAQQSIKEEAGDVKKVEFLDLSLLMQTNDEEPVNIGDDNDTLLTIVIPFDFTNVDVTSVTILRNHGDNTEKLTAEPNEDGEYVEINEAAGNITLCVMKFSDYAVAFDTLPEEEDDGECVRTKTVKLTAGTFGMKLNCKDMGEFTFTKNGSGWSIQNSDGKYLTMKDGKLVLSGTAFAWTYMNGAFSTTVKTVQKTSGHRILFIYIPGCTKTVTTTYYLSTVTNCAKLATDCTCAELYTTVSGDHDFGCRIDCKDGERHMRVCKYCGKAETEAHHFGEDGNADRCDKCGAFNPACKSVDVSATFKTKTQKQYVGFWPFGYYKSVTTYTATVKTTVTGAKVTRVEVSANQNKGWTVSNTFTSNCKIKQFYVRVTTDDGKTSLFMVCADGIGYPAN